MITIKNDIKEEIIINKSKFIGILKYVRNIDEVNKYILEIKEEYNDATHYCYAYIIDNIKRFSDDGEPSGTAGIPILNVIEQNDMNYVLLVVVRYFGGIKLGAGGLVRAYSKISSECIKNTDKAILENGYIVSLTFNYNDSKNINNIIKNMNIINKEFNELITYTLKITNSDYEKIKDYNSKIIDKIQLKKNL